MFDLICKKRIMYNHTICNLLLFILMFSIVIFITPCYGKWSVFVFLLFLFVCICLSLSKTHKKKTQGYENCSTLAQPILLWEFNNTLGILLNCLIFYLFGLPTYRPNLNRIRQKKQNRKNKTTNDKQK